MAKRYGYQPGVGFGPIRDEAYVDEVAAQRPIGATRIHCAVSDDAISSIRGDHGPNCYCIECCPSMGPDTETVEKRPTQDRVALMNRQLREG